jgi:hypothetical protein
MPNELLMSRCFTAHNILSKSELVQNLPISSQQYSPFLLFAGGWTTWFLETLRREGYGVHGTETHIK